MSGGIDLKTTQAGVDFLKTYDKGKPDGVIQGKEVTALLKGADTGNKDGVIDEQEATNLATQLGDVSMAKTFVGLKTDAVSPDLNIRFSAALDRTDVTAVFNLQASKQLAINPTAPDPTQILREVDGVGQFGETKNADGVMTVNMKPGVTLDAGGTGNRVQYTDPDTKEVKLGTTLKFSTGDEFIVPDGQQANVVQNGSPVTTVGKAAEKTGPGVVSDFDTSGRSGEDFKVDGESFTIARGPSGTGLFRGAGSTADPVKPDDPDFARVLKALKKAEIPADAFYTNLFLKDN